MASQTGVPFLGSKITLISKTGIRYEGTLYSIDPKNNTVALKNVRMFGTEGRRTDGKQIPALDKVFEYISYKGDDIRDMTVCEGPPTTATNQPQPQYQPQKDDSQEAVAAAQDTKKSTEPAQQQQKDDQPKQPDASLAAGGANQGMFGAMGGQYPYYNPYMHSPFMGPYGWTGQGGPMAVNPQQFQMPGPYGMYPPFQQPYPGGFDPFQQQQQLAQQQAVPSSTAESMLQTPPNQQQQQQQHVPASGQFDAKKPQQSDSIRPTPVKSQQQPQQEDQAQPQKPSTDAEEDEKAPKVRRPEEAASDKQDGQNRKPGQRKHRPRRQKYSGQREEKYDGDFDFESANAQFDKMAIKEEIGEEITVEAVYDKSKSFFDNLSTDTREGTRSREEREMQSRLDYQTFGVRRGRGRGRWRGHGRWPRGARDSGNSASTGGTQQEQQ